MRIESRRKSGKRRVAGEGVRRDLEELATTRVDRRPWNENLQEDQKRIGRILLAIEGEEDRRGRRRVVDRR